MGTNSGPAAAPGELPGWAAEMYARDTATRTLGMRLEGAGSGRASVRLRITPGMLNGHGIAHGGYLFLLADTAFAYACNGYGPVTVAHSAQISFLHPVEAGDDLLAEAVERDRYGRNGVYDVTVRRQDGTVVAEFRGHSVALSGRPGAARPAGGDPAG
ncbi:hydroxyphenylacetyl-CoA thioesterase PaaI [Rhizomonospora bruguierae]|uniref:hydroxyphenylacetyl-CoA thioesterase PaaI n=1 Tax=Rhizomonospora bruguierae TaxID=1581705 RepID=UPI0020BF4ACC|nr:hydroxyphenylacetyl-CoA thioesterase PaaI [Micromonospora sp. NBRC 107566]